MNQELKDELARELRYAGQHVNNALDAIHRLYDADTEGELQDSDINQTIKYLEEAKAYIAELMRDIKLGSSRVSPRLRPKGQP